MNIVGRRKLWYAISLVAIIPGTISLLVHGLRLGIDFTGGSLVEVAGRASTEQIRAVAGQQQLRNVTVTSSGEDSWIIRYADEGEAQAARHQALKNELAKLGLQEQRFDTVGPSVSRDIVQNAVVSILLVSLAIVLYVAFAFRNVPAPASSWSFGVTAIGALLHDSLLLVGIFSILGWLAGVEVDALFVTAVLTVIGFSVHDTIVVFDRIRENLLRERKSFEAVVNDSILETLGRSINTSVTVLLVLLALYLFGGESIKYFVLALMIGIASGTYSSIFNAAPLLVTWHNRRLRQAKQAR